MGQTMHNRTGNTFQPSQTMSTTFARESQQKKYKNEGYNHAYAFGGRTHIGQALTPKEGNPLLQRPSTQGSYASKRSSRSSLQEAGQKAAQPKSRGARRNLAPEMEREAVFIGNKDARVNRFNEGVEYRQPSKASSRASKVSHPQDVEGQMIIEDKPFESQDEVAASVAEDVEAEGEEVIDPILNRPGSIKSERTT